MLRSELTAIVKSAVKTAFWGIQKFPNGLFLQDVFLGIKRKQPQLLPVR